MLKVFYLGVEANSFNIEPQSSNVEAISLNVEPQSSNVGAISFNE